MDFEETDEEKAFRNFWHQLGAQSLARAYGDNEPEYPDSCVKEPNPLYESR